MGTADYLAFSLLGITITVATFSFARIEKYLTHHDLINPQAAYPNVIDYYKKYRQHTRKATGRTDRWLWIHFCTAGVFIGTGVLYTIFRLSPFILSYFNR